VPSVAEQTLAHVLLYPGVLSPLERDGGDIMRVRFDALLCLSGLVACTHQSTDVAKDPAYEHQPPVAASEPAMVPASSEYREETPSQNHSDLDTRAPAASTSKSDADRSDRVDSTAGSAPTASSSPAATAAAPDNTHVNKRDTSGAALTPMDQKNNARIWRSLKRSAKP